MQKTTLLLVDRFGIALPNQVELVVAVRDNNGLLNSSPAQSLAEWNQGRRSIELVNQAHGYNLLEILTHELGLIDVDEAGLLRHHIVYTRDPHISVMRVLGKIAEALIVKECNDSVVANRQWGMCARRGRIPHQSLDYFKAIGTGLNSTKRAYPTKYSAGDTQRDILWIHKDEVISELKQMSRGTNRGLSAGLQVKVSFNGMSYVYPDIKSSRYEVPLVYFDLSNDFDKVANAVYADRRDIAVGRDLVRGQQLSRECHEILQSYYGVILALAEGRLHPDEIIKDELLFDAFKKDIQEQNLGKEIIVV
jgi:hypothetical protein